MNIKNKLIILFFLVFNFNCKLKCQILIRNFECEIYFQTPLYLKETKIYYSNSEILKIDNKYVYTKIQFDKNNSKQISKTVIRNSQKLYYDSISTYIKQNNFFQLLFKNRKRKEIFHKKKGFKNENILRLVDLNQSYFINEFDEKTFIVKAGNFLDSIFIFNKKSKVINKYAINRFYVDFNKVLDFQVIKINKKYLIVVLKEGSFSRENLRELCIYTINENQFEPN